MILLTPGGLAQTSTTGYEKRFDAMLRPLALEAKLVGHFGSRLLFVSDSHSDQLSSFIFTEPDTRSPLLLPYGPIDESSSVEILMPEVLGPSCPERAWRPSAFTDSWVMT